MPIFGNRSGGNSQLKIRLIIMAVIAIGAVVSYLAKLERNPMTGKLDAMAMDPQQEIALGLQSAPQMARQMGGAIDPQSSAEARHVAEVGRKLAQARTEAAKSPYATKFNFYLLNDPKNVNAFALPGGQIFITRALYDRLENEAQLAGVLGHEIGHVLYRHSSQHMAASQLGQGLVGAVVAGSGDASTAQIANAVNQMIQLKYGRGDESQSDGWGLENMLAAGYDPRQMIRVMEILQEASGGSRGGSAIFASHPHPEDRIRDIKAYIKKVWNDNPPVKNTGATLESSGKSNQLNDGRK